MEKDAKIHVAGHRGLVGSAIGRRLRADGYANLVLRTSAEVDLTDQRATQALFESERPDYVFLTAGKVGGILANDRYPADFIRDNLLIQTHVIEAARQVGVEKLLFLGSSCIYLKHAPQPMREEHLLTAPLEPTEVPRGQGDWRVRGGGLGDGRAEAGVPARGRPGGRVPVSHAQL